MSWSKGKFAYKIVRGDLRSKFDPHLRTTGPCNDTKINITARVGRVLTYTIGETTESMNGLCECDNECCRGIHAYISLKEAKRYWNSGRILKVSADRWWKPSPSSSKIRAEKITVIKDVTPKERL